MYFTHPQFKFFSLKPVLGRFFETDLRNKLGEIFPGVNVVFTDSGRSAFQIAIKELKLENSQMLVPAYLCDIFLPIFKKYNIEPIYLDIDLKTFQSNISEMEEKITPRIKSILVCHTYGLVADLDKISAIARKHGLKIIEDCAHVPLPLSPRKFGDCAFFSFAKICPDISGGMLISEFPINAVLPDYKFKPSDAIKFLRLFPSLANFSEIFRKEQLSAEEFHEPRKASKLSLKLSNAYLKDYKQQLEARIGLANYFQKKLAEIGFEVQNPENNTFTYISALVPQNANRDELFTKLRKQRIFCSRIWRKPIYLNLPNTSEAAKRIINFPLQNWLEKNDIDKIISCILSAMG